jgi:hypothetical protein
MVARANVEFMCTAEIFSIGSRRLDGYAPAFGRPTSYLIQSPAGGWKT